MSSLTLYSWSYEGADADRASNGGRQHARSADSIYDDELGVGLIDKLVYTPVTYVRSGGGLRGVHGGWTNSGLNWPFQGFSKI